MRGSRATALARWFWVVPLVVAGTLALVALFTARSVISEPKAGRLSELEGFLQQVDAAANGDEVDTLRLRLLAAGTDAAIEDRRTQLVESIGQERADAILDAVSEVTRVVGLVADGEAEPHEISHATSALLTEVASQQDEDLAVRDRMVSDLYTLVLGLVVVLALGGILGAIASRQAERTVTRLRREERETQERLAERNRELAYSSQHDVLTGLLNRAAFFDSATMRLAEARAGGRQMALLYADMDRFKVLNDLRGHQFADDVLIVTARRMREAAGDEAAVGRLGGDEFAVAIPVASVSELAEALDRVQAAVTEPVALDGVRIEPALSMGVSCFPRDGSDVDFLTRHAELAMYEVKRNGGGRYGLFAPQLADAASAQHVLEVTLRDAIARDEIAVEYQPIVRIEDRAIVAVEALARWHDPERGAVPPAEFIPIAETSGLIVPLGERVIEAALGEVRGWVAEGWEVPVAVNLSLVQLRVPEFARRLEETLGRHGVPAGLLAFEVSDAGGLSEGAGELEQLRQLRELGVSTSVYDAGLARAFAGRLEGFPADALKIDGSVVARIDEPGQAAVVEATLMLGRRLGLRVIAEGIEGEAQLQRLRAFGCEYGQGFLFHRPGGSETVRAALARDGNAARRVA